ncbi:MAG: mycofactocin system GMC family oxidoreductase MftG [Mycobacteriaceae bacterium]|nr:mycofactocin system GMC family oxidoreductase MftG [Mycobacteriaceae bacterium]
MTVPTARVCGRAWFASARCVRCGQRSCDRRPVDSASDSDVVIVGAGSAGSVLAERLSADPSRRVCVVESGPGLSDPVVRALTEDATALPIDEGSPVARHLRTRLTDTPPRPGDIVRGDCVGGSGAVNGGYFCRALPEDLDWAPGWSWAEVQMHYRAVEDRLGIGKVSLMLGPTAAFVAAARAGGYRWLDDLNAAGSGVGAVPLNIIDDIRRGPGAVFLAPALDRPNLSVVTRTRAVGVRLSAGRVTGVDAVGPQGAVHLRSDRVVLCAGAIGSAQLLMLSGIGPVRALREAGIDPVADLPVGRGFADHPEWVLEAQWDGLAGHPVLEAVDLSALERGCALLTDLLAGVTGLGEPAWSTSQHLCGTAPMGSADDDDAVVDELCRVRGVSGLSVIDGSVLPRIPGRGPHATIAMLGHRAAEFF